MSLLNEKEATILKYEKNAEAIDTSNTIIKYKYVIEPNEQSLLLHQEINSLKKSLKACIRQIKQLKNRNVELININYVKLIKFYKQLNNFNRNYQTKF
jgi:hypothetical protein